MIVKKGNKWEVRDSSGKKVLGTHPTKQQAIKQLAAVEISKKERKKKVQENNELINNFMNPIENFYMLKCAQLEEERKLLQKQLNAILEDIGTIAQQAPQQQEVSPKISKVKGKKPSDGVEDPEEMDLEQKVMSPQYGLAPTPQKAAAIADLLKKYSDNPNTPQVEQPRDATWQSVNTSIGRAMDEKLRQLKAQQFMGQ